MDISEKYIKMCGCSEIQKVCYLLGQSGHDFFHDSQKGIYRGFSTASSIWLPMQDQIQKAMRDCFELGDIMEPIVFLATHILSELPEDNHYQEAETPEQLWLAFYMHEKHKKNWDGNKWVA